MDATEAPGAGSLTEGELAVVVRVVLALVDHDEAVLRDVGAYEYGGDPYLETRDWRLWDHVDLMMPPGDPRTWKMNVYLGEDNAWAGIDVDMWTVQEGRSDLTLQIDLTTDADGAPVVRFRSLHVL